VPDAVAHTDSDTDGYPESHADTDSDAHTDRNSDANTHTDTDRLRRPDAVTVSSLLGQSSVRVAVPTPQSVPPRTSSGSRHLAGSPR
jgi:hypothetical protein